MFKKSISFNRIIILNDIRTQTYEMIKEKNWVGMGFEPTAAGMVGIKTDH